MEDVRCKNCGQHTDIHMHKASAALPERLMLRIKRFESVQGVCRKLGWHVLLQEELVLQGKVHQLVAVVHHMGHGL